MALAALAVLLAGPAAARTVVDSAGRRVEVPDKVARVVAAGPPAAVLIYVVAPETMIGWPRAPGPREKALLLPAVRDLPEIGRLTGRGDSLNLERLIAAQPDLVIDFGTINDTYRSLADRVQAQTGIPYLLIDGRFENTPQALRLVGQILGVEDRGEALARSAQDIIAASDAAARAIPGDRRPRVYLARGPDGLESGTRGSINTEIIERAGAVNVVEGMRESGGLVTVSPEQIIAWAPDTIVTLDPGFRAGVGARPQWAPVPAVRQGRVFLAPRLPFGFIDAPPSVNRLAGLIWLRHVLSPAADADRRADEIRTFYRQFYRTELSDAALDRLLAGD